MSRKEIKKEVKVSEKNVKIQSTATLDLNGVFLLTTSVKNTNIFSKKKIYVSAKLLDFKNTVCYEINMKPFVLAGKLQGKSTNSQRVSGLVDFNDVTGKSPYNEIESEKVETIDSKIKFLSSKLKNLRILSKEKTPDMINIENEILALKKDRYTVSTDLQKTRKFESLTIAINYQIETL